MSAKDWDAVFEKRCVKWRYRTKLDALGAFVNLKLIVGEREAEVGMPKTEQGAYTCPRCHGIHLTSIPLAAANGPTYIARRIW